MKKTKFLLTVFISVLFVCLAFAACGADETPQGAEYSLDKTEITLVEGDTYKIEVKSTQDAEFTATYVSSNPDCATVDANGLVTALSAGTATINVTVDGKTLMCALTITKRPIDYTLNHTSASIEKGKTLLLELSCEPEQEGVEVAWESSNAAAVTVNEDGLVTAVGVGSADVNAKVDGKVAATCKVTVFEYVYTFEKSLTVDYGNNKTLGVTVTPNKPIDVKYSTADDDVISVDENGKITAVGVGTASVTVKDGENVVGTCTVKVRAAVSSVEKFVMLHVGGNHAIEITSSPAADSLEIGYEVISGADVIEIDDDGKTLNAIANGEARVKVTIDDREYFTDVLVNDVLATATVEKLEKNKNNPIDITKGAEYWEQYIANGEINHKHYVTGEEDIINRTCSVKGNYLEDYPAFLSWSGGGNPNNCDCGACAKDSYTTPDGGWNGDKGTKAYAVNVKDSVIRLDIKVFKGESVISVYTGGYNLTGMLTLKAGGATIATATFDNKGAHNAQRVDFAVDVAKDTDVVIEVVMTDDNNNPPHSCISLAAVTVSGDVYQLESKTARIIPNGTANVILKKNGTALTQGVEYEVTEGKDVVSVSENGVVTGIKVGSATVKATANGRVRYFTVNVGYSYSLETAQVNLKPNETHQIKVVSDPAGATVNATYESTNTDVATVNSSGVVTAVANGAATIKVTVDGQTMQLSVMVSGLDVRERHEATAGTIVDLTSSDIVYWEHYLYNELNPKAVDAEKGERDLIEGDISDKRGDANSTVKFYFAGSSGPKENSSVDAAWHKYSWGADYSFDITVPVGTHEIRVYTGVWKTKNKTALYDGDVELASYTFERTNDGINMLVAFTVTATEEKVLTLKINSLGGEKNCRLNAIAIVDMTAGNTELGLTANNTIEANSGKQVDLTAGNIIDWATFGENNHEKADSDMIKTDTIEQGKGAGNANDFRAEFDLGNDEKSTSFKFSDEYVSVQVGVDDAVKTMSVYMTGYNADYYLVVTDGKGKVLSTVFVNIAGGNSVAKEITFDVSAKESDTLTVKVVKLSNSNCGIAAIVLGGENA